MKIVEQTQTKLVLREFPWVVIWSAIFWLVLNASGILFIWLIPSIRVIFFVDKILLYWILFTVVIFLVHIFINGEIVECTFDKSLNRIILKQQKLLKTELIERSIEGISGIKLEVIGESSDRYRVSIMCGSAKCVPLTSVYTSNLKDKRKTAEEIATFLNVSNYGIERDS